MEGYVMFRSLSRITVAVAFVLALVLSTAPVHALPGDPGAQFESLDASWFELALSWFQDLLGGSDLEPQSLTAAAKAKPTTSTGGVGDVTVTSGSCIDPSGNPCGGDDTP